MCQTLPKHLVRSHALKIKGINRAHAPGFGSNVQGNVILRRRIHNEGDWPEMTDRTGFLVCLDVPVGTEFGIDYRSFRTAERFKGVKFIPEGLHFVFFSTGEHGQRLGMFVRIRSQDVVIREWNSAEEVLMLPGDHIHQDNLKGMRNMVNFPMYQSLSEIFNWTPIWACIRIRMLKCGKTSRPTFEMVCLR